MFNFFNRRRWRKAVDDFLSRCLGLPDMSDFDPFGFTGEDTL